MKLQDYVTFVAIKNGEHHGEGYVYFSSGLESYKIPNNSHVAKLHDVVLNFFGIK